VVVRPEELLKAVDVFGLSRRDATTPDGSAIMAKPFATPEALARVMLTMWRRFCDPQRGFLYLSVPITSGRREVSLLNRLGCSREELRTRYKLYRYQSIIRPNEEMARHLARALDPLMRAWPIMNPAGMSVANWGQGDYMNLWLPAIRQFATVIVVTNGWAFSGGSRQEVNLALELGLSVFDVLGRQLSLRNLELADRRARQTLRREGWDGAAVEAYLPPVQFQFTPFTPIHDRMEVEWHKRYFR
jgi:hypothetical protein